MRSRYFRILGLVSVIILLHSAQVKAQTANHDYPRIGVQHFGKAPDHWYARFDLVIIPWQDEDKVRRIKQLNPNCTILWTDGWTSFNGSNPVQDYIPNEAPQWWVKDSKGVDVELNWGHLMNMSSLCPKVNGQRYVDRHPEELVKQVDLSVYDGIASDWCWGKPHGIDDIDLDRNGVNDYNEHGENWVEDRWQEGVLAMLGKLRGLIGPNKLMWINSGQFQDWGWEYSNGLELERYAGIIRWNYVWRRYQEFMQNAVEPHILLMDLRPWSGDIYGTTPTKNHLKLHRFLLTVTLLGDGYYNFNPLEAGEHHYHTYYDEFDVRLGFPTSDAHELPNGCYARFFTNGAAITNPSGATKTVTDGDLQGLAGYDGPYYKFKGAQDPKVNDGNIFSDIDLFSSTQPKGGADLIVGDGIVLVKQQQTVVSDIIIDNLAYGTSAMQNEATYTGAWEQIREGEDYYSYHVRPHDNRYPHAKLNGSAGNETASFTPQIRVPGDYEVFEWHGYIQQGQMSSAVDYKIHYGNNQTKTFTIDQNDNTGKWNSLGIYNLPVGQSSEVVISNSGSGFVVADAIMFVYRGGDSVVDSVPPGVPTGVQVEGN